MIWPFMIAGGVLCLWRSIPVGAGVILAVVAVQFGAKIPEPWFSVYCASVWLLAAYFIFKVDALVGALFVAVSLPSVAYAMGWISESVRWWIDEPAVFLALAAGLINGNGPGVADYLRSDSRLGAVSSVASQEVHKARDSEGA